MTTASPRKIQALQNLAERPGTEAEGRVAREMLEKLTGKAYSPSPPSTTAQRPQYYSNDYFAKRARDAAESARKARQSPPRKPEPSYVGDRLKLAIEVRERFPIGTKVFYNAPGYPPNASGIVMGFQRAGHCVTVAFDFDGETAQIPACSSRGWHLTKQKMDRKLSGSMSKSGVRWA